MKTKSFILAGNLNICFHIASMFTDESRRRPSLLYFHAFQSKRLGHMGNLEFLHSNAHAAPMCKNAFGVQFVFQYEIQESKKKGAGFDWHTFSSGSKETVEDHLFLFYFLMGKVFKRAKANALNASLSLVVLRGVGGFLCSFLSL